MLTQNYPFVIFLVTIMLLFINTQDKGKTKIETFPLVTGTLLWTIVISSLYLLIFKSDRLVNSQRFFLSAGPAIAFLIMIVKVNSIIRTKKVRHVIIDEEIENQIAGKGKEVLDKNNTCCSKYLTDSPKIQQRTKAGKSGKIGWLFFVANYYEWELNYKVEITDAFIRIIAISKGVYSSNFQTNENTYNVTLQRQVNINCIFLEGECKAQASGFNHIDNDGHFEAAILVKVKKGRSSKQIIIGCEIVSSLKGRLFIDEVSLGAKGIVSASIKRDNKSQQHLQYSEEHEFICQICKTDSINQRAN